MSEFAPNDPSCNYWFADQPHAVFGFAEHLNRVETNGRYWIMESAERPGVRGAVFSNTCRLAPRGKNLERYLTQGY